nr:reverse transcriptase domain-containing protein [Tanacetum cinerariifolium]
MKQNGVSDDVLRLSLFPYSLTHHAIAWYDRLPRNYIHSFDDMMRIFLLKYFPPSIVTKLRNKITKPHKSLYEAWERYKLSIDRCPNHNMILVTQIDTFYNGLTLSHRDTINAAAGGTFMQKTPEECYELIENMTTHHNIGTLQRFEMKHLEISLLLLLPRVPNLLNIKEKLFDLATTSVNENCSTIILKKLPEKLGDPGKFLIPCEFPELDECLSLAVLGASINLMPLSIWKKLSFLELTPTRMILELADRSMTRPAGIAEDDTLFEDQISIDRCLCDAESVNQIDVIDVACEEYVQEILGFSEIPKSGSPTPTSNPMISSSSPSFTPFEGNDDYYDTEGDIFYLEKLLNEDPSSNLPPVKTEDLKQVDTTLTKPSIEEPPELEACHFGLRQKVSRRVILDS